MPAYLVALDAFPTKPGSGKLDYSQLRPPTEPDRTRGASPAKESLDEKKHAKEVESSRAASAFGRVASAAAW